jgi:VanZ family protein
VNFLRSQAGGVLPRLLFWAVAAFVLAMAVIPQPPQVPDVSDKVEHAAAFVTLCLLGWWAFPRLSRIRLLVLLSLFGAAIELIQMTPLVHRDGEVLDWITDTAAVAAGLMLAAPFRRAGR